MWDEVAAAAAVWLDPPLVERSQKMLVDVAAGNGADYGNTLRGRRDAARVSASAKSCRTSTWRFERLTTKLSGAGIPPAR